jgi:predicted GNAT family acetyltransferase
MDYAVVDNLPARRFETTVDGHLCVLDYRIVGKALALDHAGVPDAVGGRGIAASLTRFALGSARQRGMAVEPNCSYVAAWIRRHPEYADLVRASS